MIKNTRSFVVSLFVLVAAAGCGKDVPTASQPCPCASGNLCCSSGVCATEESSCGEATAALSATASGDWVGYVENYSFPSGSDAVKLSLQVQTDGSLAGTVVLGEGPAPAPPTDPNIGWPPPSSVASNSGFDIVEGYAYEARMVRWESLRLRLGIQIHEPWGAWCDLQTSYDSGNGVYTCIPPVTTRMDGTDCLLYTDPPQSVDCTKIDLCSPGPCTCTASGCTVVDEGIVDDTFDVALDGSLGNGSLYLSNLATNFNVRLQHQD